MTFIQNLSMRHKLLILILPAMLQLLDPAITGLQQELTQWLQNNEAQTALTDLQQQLQNLNRVRDQVLTQNSQHWPRN